MISGAGAETAVTVIEFEQSAMGAADDQASVFAGEFIRRPVQRYPRVRTFIDIGPDQLGFADTNMLNGKPSSEKVNSRPFPSSSSCSLQITVPGSGALLLWFQAIQKPRESIEPTDLNPSAFGTGQRVVLVEVLQEFPLLGFQASCEFQFTFRTTEKRFFFRFLSCVVFLCGRGQMIVLYRVYNSSIS